MLIQQGDVLIQSVGDDVSIDETKRIKPTGKGYILYEGEKSGHAHVIVEPDESTKIYEAIGGLIIETIFEEELIQDEHNPVKIPPGRYVVRKIQEYDYFQEAINLQREREDKERARKAAIRPVSD